MTKSYAPEVKADSSGNWCGNGLRFPTKEEAEANVRDLMMRWTLVTDTRAVESEDEPNYRWDFSARKLVKMAAVVLMMLAAYSSTSWAACGVAGDGTVVCWPDGSDSSGLICVPNGYGTITCY